MSVVLINAFEVPGGQEEKFLADWQHAAEWMRQQPGFVSSRLHQSLDPTRSFATSMSPSGSPPTTLARPPPPPSSSSASAA
jgi:Antibiotic biosynthesis monooxygenase